MYQANKDNPNWFCEWLTPVDSKRYCWVSDEMNLNPELEGQTDPLTGLTYMNVQDRIDSKMISYSLARQEYLNEAVADVANSVYGYEMTKLYDNGNVCEISKNDRPVYTFWDLGMDDPTAIVFAYIENGQAEIIDYYENTGHDIKHYLTSSQKKNTDTQDIICPMTLSNVCVIRVLIYWTFVAHSMALKLERYQKTNSVRDDIEIVRRHLPSCKINMSLEILLDHLTNYQWNPNTGKILHNEPFARC